MPKQVMLALVPAGGGHQSVARAVSGALAELDPSVEVSAVDVSSGDFEPSAVSLIPGLYALLTVKAPPVWRAVFWATDGRRRYALAESLVQPFVRPRLEAVLRVTRPDLVVSLNPVLGSVMGRALQRLGLRAPLGVVVSDMSNVHPAWFSRDAAWTAVPTEEARQACLAAGIDPAKIHLTGQPVGRDFGRFPASRAALRRSLGLPEDAQVVLLVGGGEGCGPLEETVQALLASGLPCYPAVVAGRNESLRRRLAAKVPPSRGQVLGYITNMADWMHAADLLVTKAGPNTVMEAVHCGLPMVLTGALPGQEEGNVHFVRSNGLGVLATRPHEIVAAIAGLLGDPARLAALKQATQRVRHPHAALEVARLILASC